MIDKNEQITLLLRSTAEFKKILKTTSDLVHQYNQDKKDSLKNPQRTFEACELYELIIIMLTIKEDIKRLENEILNSKLV